MFEFHFLNNDSIKDIVVMKPFILLESVFPPSVLVIDFSGKGIL